jgi:hypothetical protein
MAKFVNPDEISVKLRDSAFKLARQIATWNGRLRSILPTGTRVEFQIHQVDDVYFNGTGTVCKTQYTAQDAIDCGLIIDVVEPAAFEIPFSRKSVGDRAMRIGWSELRKIELTGKK